MPAWFVTGGWFAEGSGQFVPTMFFSSLDSHNATHAGYMDIFAHQPKAQQRNFYFDEFARINPSRYWETYSCFANIQRHQGYEGGFNLASYGDQSEWQKSYDPFVSPAFGIRRHLFPAAGERPGPRTEANRLCLTEDSSLRTG